MKKPLLGLLLAQLMILPAQARLGETTSECEKRYGTPTETVSVEGWLTYLKNGVSILVRFRDDKCVAITYRNVQKASNGAAKVFTKVEVDMLLAANEGGEVWKLVPQGSPTESYWETATPLGKVARLGNDRTTLTLSTKSEELRAKAEKAEREKERLKDF